MGDGVGVVGGEAARRRGAAPATLEVRESRPGWPPGALPAGKEQTRAAAERANAAYF